MNSDNNFNNENLNNDNINSNSNTGDNNPIDVNFVPVDNNTTDTNNSASGLNNSNPTQGESYHFDVNNSVDNIYAKDNGSFNQGSNQASSNNSNINAQSYTNTTGTDSTNTTSAYTINNDTKKHKKKRVKKEHKALKTVAVALVVALISGSASGMAVSYYYNQNNNASSSGSSANAVTPNAQNISIDLNNSYYAAAVYEKNKDTVVGITTQTEQSYQSFFAGPQSQEVTSIGSGVIIDANGLILTNSHVIGDGQAKSIKVTLVDGTTLDGDVKWYDKNLDLAVVKVDKTNLPAATMGDSDNVLVGEPVVAMGNPMSLDLSGTTTDGIVSGLNREITVENTTIKPLIQTSASINPGNSGGPLFNSKGEVIGINTAKLSDAEGIGFSIPINVALPIVNQITSGGKVSSVYLGVTGTDVTNYEKALGIDIDAESGFVVTQVQKDSPVKVAGIRVGDIITKIDKIEVTTISDIRQALYKYKAGDKAKITYIRDGETKTTELTFEEKPDNY